MGDEPRGSEYLELAYELADWAIQRVRELPAGRQAFDTKAGPADLVTATDRAIERHVRGRIADAYPNHRVVGEELGDSGGDGGTCWYVDPIDGTTNFAHGVPYCSFSLALAVDGQPVAGVVADLYRGTVASAAAGHGSYLDGEPVHCTDVHDLAGEVLLTEWAGHRAWPGIPEMLQALSAASCTTRILGSSALDLAMVACGRAAVAVLGRYSTWDALAGALLAQESGAVLMSRSGPVDTLPPDGLLVASPGVADAAWRAWTGAVAR